MQHTIEITQDTVRCSVCGCGWKKPPVGECPGCQLYNYEKIPWETMTTVTQLREKRLKPKDKKKPDGCYYKAKNNTYIYLYKIDEAVPVPELSDKQKAALEKATEALKAKYSCEKCGWYDKAHGQNKYTRIRITTITGKETHYCPDCIENYEWEQSKLALERQMKELLENDEKVAILDTETTGLPSHDHFQVVEVSIIDKHGTVLFDKLIKPDIPIPSGAAMVHGITDEKVADVPTFAEVWTELEKILSTYTIWCYNAEFDRQAVIHSAYYAKIKVPKEISSWSKWNCMMLAYAEYYGDWSEYYESYAWQSLASACNDLGVEGSGYHRALGDVTNTLGVMRALASRAKENSATTMEI